MVCSGVVSIKNAMSKKGCQWERTANGQARLVDPISASNNYGYSRKNRKNRKASRKNRKNGTRKNRKNKKTTRRNRK